MSPFSDLFVVIEIEFKSSIRIFYTLQPFPKNSMNKYSAFMLMMRLMLKDVRFSPDVTQICTFPTD